MSDLFIRPMFTWRSAMASAYGPESPTTRHVLLTLALHMTEKGESCFPTIKQLMAETGLSNRPIIEHIAKAEAAGWLGKRELPMVGKGLGWRRIEYFPLIPEGVEKELNRKGSDAGSPREAGDPSAEGGDFDDKKVVTQGHTSTSVSTSKSTSKENPEKIAPSTPTPTPAPVKAFIAQLKKRTRATA